MTIFKYLSGTLLALATMNLCAFSMPDENSVNIKFIQPSQESMQNSINKDSELQELISDMKYQLISAQNEIEKLQETNFLLKNSIEEKEKEISALFQSSKTNETQIISTINTKNTEISELNSLNENYKIQNESYKRQNESYKKQIDDLTLKLSNLNNELNKNKENYLTYSEKNIQLINDNMQLHEKYLNLQSKVDQLNNEIEKEKTLEIRLQQQQTVLKNQEIYLRAIDYLKNDKNNAVIYYSNLAKAYLADKDYGHAIESYNQALVINPEYTKAYREMGIINAEAGNYAESIANLNAYLKYTNNIQEKELIKGFIARIEKTS